MGTQVQKLPEVVWRARYEDLSKDALVSLKVRILDALGCAIGALDAPPTRLIRDQTNDFGGAKCTLIGGDRTAPDRAGGFCDYIDIFEAPDTGTAMKVALLVRSFGRASAEIWPAAPWDRFLDTVKRRAS